MVWLGPERGALTDWTTQQWVRLTGRRIDLARETWLEGPVGRTTGIGADFYHQLAREQGLGIHDSDESRGLIRFDDLRGPRFDPNLVDSRVRDFYEQTSDYEMESWAEWCGLFRPFGRLLALIFSRRLQQLNVPIDSLDTSGGTVSEVLVLVDPASNQNRYTAWVRQLRRTGNVLYAGTYSVERLPGHDGPCVKVVFPLPNGNAIVCLRPEVDDKGRFTIVSSGEGFGDPGFYFTVHAPDGRIWARYVRSMRESICVYGEDEPNEVRADHILAIWGCVFLRFHYRLRQGA